MAWRFRKPRVVFLVCAHMLLHVACFTDSADHGVHGGFGPDVVGDVVTAVADGFDAGQEVGFANGAEFAGEPLHVGVDGAHLGVGSNHEGITVDSDEVDKLGVEGVANGTGFAAFLRRGIAMDKGAKSRPQ